MFLSFSICTVFNFLYNSTHYYNKIESRKLGLSSEAMFKVKRVSGKIQASNIYSKEVAMDAFWVLTLFLFL